MMEFLKERSHQSRQSKAVVLQPEQQVFLLAGLQQKPLRVSKLQSLSVDLRKETDLH